MVLTTRRQRTPHREQAFQEGTSAFPPLPSGHRIVGFISWICTPSSETVWNGVTACPRCVHPGGIHPSRHEIYVA